MIAADIRHGTYTRAAWKIGDQGHTPSPYTVSPVFLLPVSLAKTETGQDAGLIFLSRMTTDVAERAILEGKMPHEAMATALATTALGTALLGVALVIVGKLKLAKFVAYLPMPVVSQAVSSSNVSGVV